MEDNKKSIIFGIITAILLVFFVGSYVIKADSGWDSDWDSGWDSGWDSDWDSGWDSGSSWDSDWGYSSGGSSEGNATFVTIFILFVILFIIFNSRNNKQNISQTIFKMRDNNLDAITNIKNDINNFDEEDFLNYTYQLFVDVQNAWMEFDYNKLSELLTDELYNTYKMQLKALNAKKQKNIMNDFILNKNVITDYYKTEKEYVIKTTLYVSFFDYLIDKDEKVIRGNSYRKINMEYELTFIKSISEKDNKCPNCSAQLPNKNSNYCTYCGSKIISNNHDWILSKKEAISQR